MIFLTISFCLLATGQCQSRRVPDVTYPSIQACQMDGEKIAAGIAAEWEPDAGKTLRVSGITCAVDPQDPAGWMAGYWQSAGTTSVAVNAATGAAAGGQVTRIRAITASCSGAGNFVVSDSVLGTLLQINFTAAAQLIEADYDIRGSAGGNLTVSWSANGSTISLQGDFVPSGYAYGMP